MRRRSDGVLNVIDLHEHADSETLPFDGDHPLPRGACKLSQPSPFEVAQGSSMPSWKIAFGMMNRMARGAPSETQLPGRTFPIKPARL